MSYASHGAVHLKYIDEGKGPPVLLIHGFASTHAVNWVATGWVDVLVKAGYRVIAFDNRGHGQSTKLYSPDQYHVSRMAEDALAVIRHLDLKQVDVMGYSMGARIGAFLALHHPAQVRRLIMGGLGMHLIDGVGLPQSIAEALEAPSLADVHDRMGRTFRAFADQTRSDLKALAACIRGSRQVLSRSEVSSLSTPTLVAVGSKDLVSGDGRELAELLPQGQFLDIPDRDHMLAVGDRVYKAGVVEFLRQQHG